jgi:hypothetical protein
MKNEMEGEECSGKGILVHKKLVGGPERKKSLGRHRPRWKFATEVYLK